MEDKFKEIIESGELYAEEFVRTFGIEGAHWHQETWRKRELSLRHDMVCVLLCNLQLMDIKELYNTLKRKRNDRKEQEESINKAKRIRELEINLQLEETRTSEVRTPELSMSSGSGTGSSNHTQLSRIGEMSTPSDDKNIYRFWMIEGMPNAGMIQANLAQEFKCPVPDSQWDIGDRDQKKFLEVKVTTNSEEALLDFRKKRMKIPNNSSLVCVNPSTTKISWYDHPGAVDGEPKALAFLMKRYQVLRDKGIMDSGLTEEINPETRIFNSDYLNGLISEWEKDWWDSSKTKLPTHITNLSVPRVPTVIKASKLIKLLSDLQEPSRKGHVKWKGKLLPEGFTRNKKTPEEEDSRIVKTFIQNYLCEDQEDSIFLCDKNPEETTLTVKFLSDFLAIYEEGQWSHLIQLERGKKASPKMIRFSKALGIGMKKKKYFPEDETTRQPETKTRVSRKYHTWFDEVMRRWTYDKQDKTTIPFFQLLESGPTEGHPIGDTAITLTTTTLKNILSSQAAVHAQKRTNLFSRLGGAYLQRKGKMNYRDNAAVFPIYSTARDVANGRVKYREVSGIVIRGPNHAKSPTDRISFITVELIKEDPGSLALLRHLPHCMVYKLKKTGMVVVRQNAILKEDTSYGTFSINAAFLPLNLVGTMLLENPNVTVGENPFHTMSKHPIAESKWIRERFVEGVMMAEIGNSCDEGYFAMLRKIFMVVQNLRNDQWSTCWDPEGLCDATNECLIDNPLSMHLHQTLLTILRHYVSKGL